jgi:hypothetical protein
MANPFPFTAGQVLTAAEMNGIGETTSFTPTIAGYTRGNGTTEAAYLQVNKMVYVYVREVFGSTSSITGALTFTLPINAVAVGSISGWAALSETGVALNIGFTRPLGTTSVAIEVSNAASTYARVTAISSTVPFTWGNTDVIHFALSYEAA